MPDRGPGFRLCLITTARESALGAVARALQAPNAARIAVLLRDAHVSPATLHAAARRLAGLVRAHHASLRIHTDAALALEVNADGVHLAGDPPDDFRRRIDARLRVGVSCHDARQLASAARGGADYAFLSPLFSTPGKAPALGEDRFAQLSRQAGLPVVALGGLGPDNAAGAIAAGACGVACIRAVLDADDPADAAQRMLSATEGARAQGRSR